jgi:hypothetical protein
MPVNEKFLAARAEEQRNRSISYLPEPEPLYLPLGRGRVVRVRQSHLTVRAEHELRTLGNPLFVGGTCTRRHAFQFLWRLHPCFLRRNGRQPNLCRWATLWQRFVARCIQLRLAYLCGALAWPASILVLQARLDRAYQDDPAADAESDRAPALPLIHAVDELCRHFEKRGLSREAVLDSPVACLLQSIRAERLASPEGEIDVIDPSDALLGATP